MFKPEIKIYHIGELGDILHLHYEKQYELCSTFMRLQEFYESDIPEIKGNFFSLEEYMDAYANRMGNFSYTSDWSGFNVPSNVYYSWLEKFKNDLLRKEEALVDIISKETNKTKFYIIGSYGDNKNAIVRHEIAHAL